jgi:hypothetical protein
MKAGGLVVIGLTLCAANGVAADGRLTCNPEELDPRSYRLTTRGVAMAVTRPRHDWWDSFELGKYKHDLADLNWAVTRAAERALEIDPRNAMGHSILARQYLIVEDAERADAAWRTVFDQEGAVVYASTFYDLDGRDWFFTFIDREGMRIYQWSQLAAVEKRRFGGILEYPGPEDERFWRAGGGCIDGTEPHAFVPWSGVREIRAGNWVLWFELDRPVTLVSDRNGKRKTFDRLKVGFHGRTGELEVYKPVGEERLAMRGRGPAGYNDMLRRTIARFVDTERRIALPPVRPGVGW